MLPSRVSQDFITNAILTEFPRGTMLLSHGEVCNFIGLAKSGISRKFHFRKKREVTTEFFFANDFITSFHSYHLGQASRENIQILENSEIYILTRDKLQELKAQHPELKNLSQKINLYYALWLEQRLHSLQFQSAMERYQYLEQMYPHFLQTIPLRHLASFLGMTMETLSRIRNQKARS